MDSAGWAKTAVRGIMCLGGIIGNNWLLISSLPKSMSQLRTNDILFINLAVSNLITNYLVDPINIFKTGKYMPVGKLFCSFRMFLPELSETSSILSTTFITVYWHQKLVGSLKHGGAPVPMDNLHYIAMLLTASWTFSIFFHVPHILFAEVSGNITTEDCDEKLPSPEGERAYEITYVVLVNVIPISAVIYASSQIVITLLQNEKRMKKMSSEAKNEGNNSDEKSGDGSNNISTVTKSKSQTKSGSLVRAAKSVVAVAICFIICWDFHIVIRTLLFATPSSLVEDIESFVGAFYICIIPYIYLYGAQKLTCSTCLKICDGS